MNGKGAKLSVYLPPGKGGHELLARLRKVAEEKDRSLNYIVVEAVLEYLQREEQSPAE